MKRFLIRTLGCKVNQYDSEVLRESLISTGWTESEDTPSLVIVNTCTVTAVSDEKSRKLIRRLHRRFPLARIVATGCYAERDTQALLQVEGVSDVIPGRKKWEVLSVAEESAHQPATAPFFGGVGSLAGHSRAFLKIEDGCESFCSYCIVPLVRGPVRSRDSDDAIDEARRLIDSGFQEIVLTGIHLGAYGKESGNESLPQLVERMCEIPGQWRLRLSSIEIGEVSDRLLDAMTSSEKVCPHLHIPLQSGDDRILKLMNRRYTRSDFLDAVKRLRKRLPAPGLTTDVLVGFPGEGELEFESTRSLCREITFSRLHVFPFSPREGTLAFAMPGRLPPTEIRPRVDELCALGRTLQDDFAKRFIDRTVEVLVESKRDKKTGMFRGYSERYVRVMLNGPDDLKGTLVRAKGIKTDGAGTLVAEQSND